MPKLQEPYDRTDRRCIVALPVLSRSELFEVFSSLCYHLCGSQFLSFSSQIEASAGTIEQVRLTATTNDDCTYGKLKGSAIA